MMFIGLSGSPDDRSIEVMRSYGVQNIICIAYSYSSEMSGRIESSLPGCQIDYLEADGPEDMDLLFAIKALVIGTQGKTFIDVTYASPYHAAVCMDLGGSDKTELYYSRLCAPGEFMHERLDRIWHYYGGLSNTHYEVLDVLNQRPQMTEQIVKGLKGVRSQSTVYAALSDLCSRGLIDRTVGTVPEGYNSRVPNFFRLNPDQQWDYYSYKRLDRKRTDEQHVVEVKQKISKETKKSSLRSKRASGRKSV